MNQDKSRHWLKHIFIGKARDIGDHSIFHKLSLIAVLAWVGLGADGLSSSCYGPEETIKALGPHPALAPFVALACVLTIAVICASYSQIIGLFPGGGGGYLVASKLLSPAAGAVSGCALLVDYVLTIAISIASGADQLFSVLPPAWLPWKMTIALAATLLLTVLNLRGVKESVVVWTPVFFLFLLTHGFAILYGLGTHLGNVRQVATDTMRDVGVAHSQLGWVGMGLLLMKAYSLGAGSYTGIEAVSNGLPILREPRAATGKRTMLYMGLSLALMVGGLLVSYVIFGSMPHEGKTLNAVLFEQITAGWPDSLSVAFVWISMLSAAALLFIAAQTGFLDGPRVLANMAIDRWFPTRFATLSDRFVAQNGIVLMGIAALVVIAVSRGSVDILVVLYSINVFVTFSLSQLGMVVHWWKVRRHEANWRRPLAINAVGFALTAGILVSLSVMKFHEGGWVTLVVTSLLIGIAFLIKRHYRQAREELARLDDLLPAFQMAETARKGGLEPVCDPKAKTAVVFVNGYNGLGVHTILDNLEASIARETRRYADYMRAHGIHGESVHAIGTDILSTARDLAAQITQRFPNCIFFGGQLVFKKETYLTRLLHNFAVFVLQREFFKAGLPFFVLPIRV